MTDTEQSATAWLRSHGHIETSDGEAEYLAVVQALTVEGPYVEGPVVFAIAEQAALMTTFESESAIDNAADALDAIADDLRRAAIMIRKAVPYS